MYNVAISCHGYNNQKLQMFLLRAKLCDSQIYLLTIKFLLATYMIIVIYVLYSIAQQWFVGIHSLSNIYKYVLQKFFKYGYQLNSAVCLSHLHAHVMHDRKFPKNIYLVGTI